MKGPLRRLLGWGLAVALAAGVVAASVSTVRQDESGVRMRFGRPVGVLEGGLHLTLPYPIERVIRVPSTQVRAVSVGLAVPGTRGAFRAVGLPEDQWLTGDANIVELEATVLYTVTDPVTFLFGLSGDGERRQEDSIQATAEAVLTRLMAGMTIDSILATGKLELSRRGQAEIQDLLDELRVGVRLSALHVSEVGPPGRVISAFNDVSSAKSDRERMLMEAEGLQGTVLPRAQARARARVQEARAMANRFVRRAEGDAAAFRGLAAEFARHPGSTRERLWFEAMERILQRTEEKILPPGSQVVLGP